MPRAIAQELREPLGLPRGPIGAQILSTVFMARERNSDPTLPPDSHCTLPARKGQWHICFRKPNHIAAEKRASQ